MTVVNSIGIKMEDVNYDDLTYLDDEVENNSDSVKNQPTQEDKALIQEGKNSANDSKTKRVGASGWTDKCKSISSSMGNENQKVHALDNNFKQITKQALQKINKNNQEIAVLSEKNEEINAKIETLTEGGETDSTFDGTGTEENSAFSLSFEEPTVCGSNATNPSGNPFSAPSETPSTTPSKVKNETSTNDGTKTEIETLKSELDFNSATISNKTQDTAVVKKTFNQQSKSTKQTITAARAKAAEADKQAKTAQVVGTVTTTVGVAVSAVGALMAAGVFTAPAAPPVAAEGVTSTVAGGAATGAATGAGTAAGATAGASAGAAAGATTGAEAVAGTTSLTAVTTTSTTTGATTLTGFTGAAAAPNAANITMTQVEQKIAQETVKQGAKIAAKAAAKEASIALGKNLGTLGSLVTSAGSQIGGKSTKKTKTTKK